MSIKIITCFLFAILQITSLAVADRIGSGSGSGSGSSTVLDTFACHPGEIVIQNPGILTHGKCSDDVMIKTIKECKARAEKDNKKFDNNQYDIINNPNSYPPGCFDWHDYYHFNDPHQNSNYNCKHDEKCICKIKKWCEKCPKNTYSNGGSVSTCTPCSGSKPTTNFATGESSCMAVPSKLCEKGYGVSGDGIDTPKQCIKCERNTYSHGGIDAKCTACPPKTPYTYINFDIFTSERLCTSTIDAFGCLAGKGLSKKTCKECPKNTFSKGGIDAKCTACPGSEPTTNFATGESSCMAVPSKLCEKGSKVSGDGINIPKTCENCPSGKYKDTKGESECKPCPQKKPHSPVGSTSESQCGFSASALSNMANITKGKLAEIDEIQERNNKELEIQKQEIRNATLDLEKQKQEIRKALEELKSVKKKVTATTKPRLRRKWTTKDIISKYNQRVLDQRKNLTGLKSNDCKKETKRSSSKESMLVFPAVPMEVENTMPNSDGNDGVNCLEINRDSVVNAYCEFRQEFDQTLQEYKITNKSKDFWPNICCASLEDDCKATKGIEQIDMIPFSMSQGGNATNDSLWKEMHDLMEYKDGHIHKGMINSLNLINSGDVKMIEERLETMFQKVNLCGPYVFRSMTNTEMQMCQLFHAYNHMFHSFHSHFKSVLVNKDAVILDNIPTSKRRRLLSQNNVDDGLCKGITAFKSCDSTDATLNGFYPPSKSFIHVRDVKYIDVPKNCKVTIYSKVYNHFSTSIPLRYTYIGGAQESVPGLSAIVQGPKKMCVTDILPTVAGMIVENHIDVVEYLNQVVGKEMNGLKDKFRNGKIKFQGSQGEKGQRGNDGLRGTSGDRGATGMAGPMGPRGIPGERGNDGTGLTLKSFKINQIYHRGDYVFSKSSKDGHDSMFIAEKTFKATEMPSLDLASDNWAEFRAPRGLRGSNGDRGAIGMAGATGMAGPMGPRGIPGPPGKDIINKVEAETIHKLQKQVEELDHRNPSCPHLNDASNVFLESNFIDMKKHFCNEYNLDLSTPNTVNYAMIDLDEDIGKQFGKTTEKTEKFKRVLAARVKYRVTDSCTQPMFNADSISLQKIEDRWVLIVELNSKSGYLQHEINDKCENRRYMPTTEIGLQLFEDTENCCNETTNAMNCLNKKCNVRELTHAFVDHPLSYTLTIIGNAFYFKLAHVSPHDKYVLEGTRFTNIVGKNYVEWKYGGVTEPVNDGFNNVTKLDSVNKSESLLEIDNSLMDMQKEFEDFKKNENVSVVKCAEYTGIFDGVTYDGNTFEFDCYDGASKLCKCIMNIGKSFNKEKKFETPKYTLRFIGKHNVPSNGNMDDETMKYIIEENHGGKRRRRLLSSGQAGC